MAAAAPAAISFGASAAKFGMDAHEKKKQKQAEQEKYNLKSQEDMENLSATKKKLEKDRADKAKRRRNLLKERIAERNAILGSTGLSPTRGSSKALLDGMRGNVEEEIAKEQDEVNTQTEGLNRAASYSSKRNILEYNKKKRDMYAGVRKDSVGMGSSAMQTGMKAFN